MLDGYAVFDFETTGLKPRGQDKIVEIGVVLLDRNGEFESEFTTLVNPGRDLGPTHIHHIKGADVAGAPTFKELAGHLSNLLHNRLLVAHNAQFDMGFLEAEFNRAIPELGGFDYKYLCTMKLSRQFLPENGRSLDSCCGAYDIEIEAPHHALADARATAKLLQSYMRELNKPEDWANLLAVDTDWPEVEETKFSIKARPFFTSEEPYLLSKISRLPDLAATEEENEFLAILDRVIADEVVTVQESQELLDAAAHAGITSTRLEELRRIYFLRLVDLVWEDGVLTGSEEQALDRVAEFMGVDDELLAQAKSGPFEKAKTAVETHFDFRVEQGSLVVLTGDMVEPRSHYEAIVTGAGFKVAPAVTKKVSLVVAADATSISGKARKARDYGIPIVQIEDFLAYLGN